MKMLAHMRSGKVLECPVTGMKSSIYQLMDTWEKNLSKDYFKTDNAIVFIREVEFFEFRD